MIHDDCPHCGKPIPKTINIFVRRKTPLTLMSGDTLRIEVRELDEPRLVLKEGDTLDIQIT